MGKELLLKTRGLKFSYSKPVIRGIDFELYRGDFLSLIGPNGSGKTTFLKLLNGILRPDGGEIFLGKKPLSELSRLEIARRVAYVPQDSGLDFDFRVMDFVMLGRNPYLNWWGSTGIEDQRIVKNSMEMTRTWEFRNKLMGELSGGERQRVFLARALAQKPELLFLDEPVAHLDINYQQEIFNLLHYLNLEGMTLVVVSHDLNLASRFSSRLALFKDGEIFCSGSPRKVLTPENIYRVYQVRVRLINGGDIPFIQPEIQVDFSTSSLSFSDTGERKKKFKVHLVGGGGSGRGLLNFLQKTGVDISVGVLNRGDADWEEATRLNLKVIEEKPFSPISPEKKQLLADRLQECHAVIVGGVPFGHGNLTNLEALLNFAGDVLLLEEDVIDKRDYTGGEAVSLWEILKTKENVKVFSSERDLLRYFVHNILGGRENE